MMYVASLVLILASCTHARVWGPNGNHGTTNNLPAAQAKCLTMANSTIRGNRWDVQELYDLCMNGEGWEDTNR